MGNYDFEHIIQYARKRFIDGYDTATLLRQANSQREREEIVLVCILDVKEDVICDLELSCRHASKCESTDCRARLRNLIQRDLADQKNLE
jgi:hypothetical protein